MREDCNGEKGYDEFKKNENLINNLPLEQMSKLTLSLLSQCNFNKTKNKRLKNFKFIHARLSDYNKIKISLDDDDVPMIYPFVYFKKNLKSKLIENKIFVPTYWNNIYCSCKLNKNEEDLQQFLIALPIDQRYNTNDMKYIFKILKKYLI